MVDEDPAVAVVAEEGSAEGSGVGGCFQPAGGFGVERSVFLQRVVLLFGEQVDADFGGVSNFAEAVKAAATGHFGSGWAWLIWDAGALKIVTTSNADTPIVRGQAPLLVIDVWEHAYYLDHHERRAAYVAGVVDNLLDWEFAERNFDRASGNVAGEVLETVIA